MADRTARPPPSRAGRFFRQRAGIGPASSRSPPIEIKCFLEKGRARMLSSPPPDEPVEAARLRGHIFTELDRLAFALELEAAALVEARRTDEAEIRQHMRLGVRLAQRLVAGVWADEVNLRLQRTEEEYDRRLRVVA
jgi:hypothetical protein